MSSKSPRKSAFIWKFKTDFQVNTCIGRGRDYIQKCFYFQCFALFLGEFLRHENYWYLGVVDLDTFHLIFLGRRHGP